MSAPERRTISEQSPKKFVPLPTGIATLDDLLDGGIECPRDRGFFGVVFGAAGTGKSVLGLQLCYSFVLDEEWSKEDQEKWCGEDENRRAPRCAIYISQEPARVVCDKVKTGFGNFQRNFSASPQRAGGMLPSLSVWCEDETERPQERFLRPEGPRVYICEMPLEWEAQSEKLENLFDMAASWAKRLRDQARKNKEPQPWQRLLIVVDNAETIYDRALLMALREKYPWLPTVSAASPASRRPQDPEVRVDEWRQQDPNFYRRIRRYWNEHGLHAYFLYEEKAHEGRNPEATDVSTTPEAYAADLVVRLGLQTRKGGFRDRFIEILKAKNQFYYRGKHSFSVVGELQDEAHRGITIYPSVATQLSWLREERGESGKAENGAEAGADDNLLNLGIRSLDQEIKRLCGANVPHADDKSQGYIPTGSSSVLVSDLDLKATQIALHFALSADRALFISFLHQETDLRKMARAFGALKNRLPEAIQCQKAGMRSPYRFKYYPPEHISENKLMRDIDLLVRDAKEDLKSGETFAVVVDNVFELGCKYPLIENGDHFITALYELFRVRGATSLVVDTVEAGEARNPIETSKAAGLADNVFLLRHVEFQSRPHHVFSVLKLVKGVAVEHLWDIEEMPDRENGGVELQALDTFEFYKNVLLGKPEPVTFTLTLYRDAEGSPFDQYVNGQLTALEKTLGPEVRASLYGAEEYARVQNILISAKPRLRPECHIVALDEFWLMELIQKGALESIGELVRQGTLGAREFLDRKQFVSAAHDIALYKLATQSGSKRDISIGPDWYKRWYAIPARNNCGILCCDPSEVRARLDAANVDVSLRSAVDNWLKHKEDVLNWKLLRKLKDALWPEQRKGTEGSVASREVSQSDVISGGGVPKRFFTFCMDQMESCVSFLLELALSYKPRNELVREKDETLRIAAFPPEAFETLLDLLDIRDMQTLAAGVFRPAGTEPSALFSRQWMSTLGCLRTCPRASETGEPQQRGVANREREYFLRLQPFPLPASTRGYPTPVSGTWYMGILKGSVAVAAGVRVIQQFTSVADEMYKLNNYIGLPVRRAFYERSGGASFAPFRIPYSDHYAKVAEQQIDLLSIKDVTRLTKRNAKYEKEVLHSEYPFYRMSIKDYQFAAPVLWRLMVHVAQGALAGEKGQEKRIDRNAINRAIKAAAQEYQMFLNASGLLR